MEYMPVVLAALLVALLFTLMFVCFVSDSYESKKIKFYQKEIEDLKLKIYNLDINRAYAQNREDLLEFENSLLKKEIEEIKRK